MNVSKLELGLRLMSVGTRWAATAAADGDLDLEDGVALCGEMFDLMADVTDDQRCKLGLDIAATVLAWAGTASADGRITGAEVRRLTRRLEASLKRHGQDLAVELKPKAKKPRAAPKRAKKRQARQTSPRAKRGKANGAAGAIDG